MIDEDSLQKLQKRNAAILPQLDERQRRLFAASEARAAGHGGIAAVSRVTRIAASTIGRGLKELDAPPPRKLGGVRRPGGGRKSLTETDPGLLDDLNALVEPDTRGDPTSPLRWTCKSLRRLAAELDKLGHKISHTVVGELLKKQKFSLQANSKTREGADNPDRDAQFCVINDAVKTAMAENQPAISVDTKKKELVGDFKNAGREWRKQGDPEEVRVHDFLIKELGRAVPYMEFMIWPLTRAGSTSGSTTTRRPSRFRRSADGGKTSAVVAIRSRAAWSSLPMAADRTARACDCGNLNCSASPMNSEYQSRSIICRQEPANGTRSVCHEHIPREGRCGAVQEMRAAPSRSTVRCRPQTAASCDRQERSW